MFHLSFQYNSTPPLSVALPTPDDNFTERTNGGGDAKTYLWAYVDSEGPDQPVHPHSLIRAFAVR